MIEIRNLSKSFDEIRAVSDVSLNIREHEVFGLVGTNGAGKSTLLRMIADTLVPDQGEVFIDGKPVHDDPLVKRKVFFIAACGLCTSIMWGGIFNLSVEGLGKYTEAASGIFMTMVVGGGIMPLIQEAIAKSAGEIFSYWLVIAMLAYILFYALIGSKNVNKDIKVD